MIKYCKSLLRRLKITKSKSADSNENPQTQLISALFEKEWYLQQNKNLAASPVAHFMEGGWKNTNPNPYFDAKWYCEQHPEVRHSGLNPLIHYVLEGEPNGERPSERFDPKWYLEEYSDVRLAGLSPLAHYLKHGATEGRSPLRPSLNEPTTLSQVVAQLFDASFYSAKLDEPVEGDFLEHYLNGGWKVANPNPYFDLNWYFEQNSEANLSGSNPLFHYLEKGESEGKTPSPFFDPNWYVENYPDIEAAGISPLHHFLVHGKKEKRLPVRPSLFKSYGDIERFASSLMPSMTSTKVSATLLLSPVIEERTRNIYVSSYQTAQGVREVQFPKKPSIDELEKVFILGGTRYLISSSGKLVHEESYHFRQQPFAHEKYYGAKRAGKIVNLTAGMRTAAWIPSAIGMMHEYENNYFHFVSEIMPRVILAQESVIDPTIPYAITDDLHPNMGSLLNRLIGDERKILRLQRGLLYKADCAINVGDCSTIVDAYDGGDFSRASAIDIKRIQKAVSITKLFSAGKKPTRIFAFRAGRSRVLINQGAIFRALKKYGFICVDASRMTLDQQIEAFSNAEIVVGPTGAQLTNLIWCSSGSKALVLASDHPSHQLYLWELLGKVSGMSVETLLGPRFTESDQPYGVHDDYIVNLDAVVAKVSEIMKD